MIDVGLLSPDVCCFVGAGKAKEVKWKVEESEVSENELSSLLMRKQKSE